MIKNKYYAVAVGVKTGIYSKWFGKNGAQIQINGFKGAVYKGFTSIEEAENFMKQNKENMFDNSNKKSKIVKIYTDGCSLGNPGPGGCGIVIIQKKIKKEISCGFKYSTNNRMELMACIIGLSKFKEKSYIDLYSDSLYVINGISKGWAKKWQKNKWLKSDKKKARNTDLWEILLKKCSFHKVNFIWVKGHNGDVNNERCDKLANNAAKQDKNFLHNDEFYIKNINVDV